MFINQILINYALISKQFEYSFSYIRSMDDQIRNAAFIWLGEQTRIYSDVLPWEILKKGFEFQGQQIIPIGAKGIWKPKIMDYPLSITTAPDSPYEDSFTQEGFLMYKYRGTDPYHSDNAGLRETMRLNKPLIYFHGVLKGKYLTTWPVYIVQDNITDLTFTVAVDNISQAKTGNIQVFEDDAVKYYRRSYLTSSILIRLHQRSFRERVLRRSGKIEGKV